MVTILCFMGMSSIPGYETKIPNEVQRSQRNNKRELSLILNNTVYEISLMYLVSVGTL